MAKKKSLFLLLATVSFILVTVVTSCNENKYRGETNEVKVADTFREDGSDMAFPANTQSGQPDEEVGNGDESGNAVPAPEAGIYNTSINYNDENTLVYKFSISATGVKGHVLKPYLYIFLNNGEHHRYNNQDVCFAGQTITSTADHYSCTSQQTISTSIDNLHSLDGTHIYKPKIYVMDETTGEWLPTSCDEKRYSYSLGVIRGANGEITGRITTPITNPDAKGKVRNAQHGDHGTIICANCGGTGREQCIDCSGTGRVWSYNLNTTVECSMCHGSGYRASCPVCHGTGQRYY